ncbi:hypothetical protein LCGC14_2067710 [marine sediment metagenome]|uniref:Uncharacterized protein n=1 Tax=marine sediment metagenome TaxID=412755 RepID=A0A0F9GXT3_9ZZZZ|nr:hypothetical protein [Desulfobacterales bacterium]
MKKLIAIILLILFIAAPVLAKRTSVMVPKFKWDNFETGDAASGWLLNVYEAGTTTRKDSYPAATGATTNANPVVLDSHGEAIVYIDGVVKLVLTDETGDSTKGFSLDNFEGASVGSIISRVVATTTALESLTGETDGELAIVQANPAGLYTWDSDNSKWRVRAGNIYPTASLPASATYTIETGTTAYDSTVSKSKVWNGTAWEIVKTLTVLQVQVFN